MCLRKCIDSVAYRSVGEETIVVNLKDRSINILNSVASRFWELMNGKRKFRDIVYIISREFEVSFSEAGRDCNNLLVDLKIKGLADSPLVGVSSGKKETNILSKEKNNNVYAVLREKAAIEKIPIVVHLDLTYKCNLRCRHCYLVLQDRRELTTSKIRDVLSQLADMGTIYLTLSGGEILLRKDLFDIASFARELNFAVRFLTNGTLLDENSADKLSSFCPELVSISIYSIKPEVHDSITQKEGSFQKSVAAAKFLRNKGVNLKIATIIMRQNVHNYGLIAKLADDLGAQFQADYRITPKTNGCKLPLRLHISDKDLKKVFLDSTLQKGNDNFEENSSPQGDYKGIFNIIPCGAGHLSCYISPYGDVYPCVQLPINCGNLREKTFFDIWRKSPQILNMRSITIDKLPVCGKCDLFQYCRLCIGLNQVEERNVLIPSQRACKEANLRKELGQKRR